MGGGSNGEETPTFWDNGARARGWGGAVCKVKGDVPGERKVRERAVKARSCDAPQKGKS